MRDGDIILHYLAKLVRWAYWFLVVTAAILFVGAIQAVFFNPTDATDLSPEVRSNLRLHTDYGTGCQYLSTREGYLVPRLNSDGKHACPFATPGAQP